MGAILTQNKHPIAYFSQALGVRGQAKSIYEKELMAIVLAIQKWRHYLIGRHFVVWTDQRSLGFILEQREVGIEYQNWASELLGYDFEVHFKPGKQNNAADAFSRHPQLENVQFSALAISSVEIDWAALKEEIAKDPTLSKLKADLCSQRGEIAGYYLHHEQPLYKGRLVIPKSSLVTCD